MVGPGLTVLPLVVGIFSGRLPIVTLAPEGNGCGIC